ncbi:MAG TPA: radical SAM protein [Thermoanaerobaculia bacterium]|nr:radical SAM protein [Thermoanaerobaculia bacterium]
MSAPGVFLAKAGKVLRRKAESLAGRLVPLEPTLESMALRPYELHFELTNLCNANCVFCPYQFQEREVQFMPDEVFRKAVADFVASGGGSVGLTPIVGDALIHPDFVDRVRHLRSFPAVDRIWVTTNAILLDQHGIDEILASGLTSITISTSGFDEASYRRVYRSSAYQRFRRNVLALVERNRELPEPLTITIGLRTDRPLDEVMKDPDFQPILAYGPDIDFTWSFTSAGGRITREALPQGMRLRVVSSRKQTCVQLYNGPIVLPDGTVMACSCVAAMDAVSDLGIGNVLEADLSEIWRNDRMRELRASFAAGNLNKTCAGCDMYRGLDLYRTSEGRERAEINKARGQGEIVHREKPKGAFSGG